MRFLLIRHAATVWNRERRYQGRSDVPLSDCGRRQAALLAQRLRRTRIDRIYSSPLSRVYDTAEELAGSRGLDVISEERFQEIDFGEWEGLTRQELEERFGTTFLDYRREPFFYPLPGEGSLNRARLRVGAAVEEIREKYRDSETVVAIVAHEGILKLVLFSLLDMSSRFYRCFELGNTSVTIVDVLRDRAMVRLLNDMHHLEPIQGQGGQERDPRRTNAPAVDPIAINVCGKS